MRNTRKNARTVRAIKAYWLAEARKANAYFQACSEEWANIKKRPASDFEDDVERYGYEYSQDALLADVEGEMIEALIAMRNATNRYRMAIPKNGIGGYKGGKKMLPVWLCVKEGYDVL